MGVAGGVKIQSPIHIAEPFSRSGWTGITFGMFAIHNPTFKELNRINERAIYFAAFMIAAVITILTKKYFLKIVLYKFGGLIIIPLYLQLNDKK
ncbi:MAG: hypothetical protein H7Z13_05445 [Ferruginibacter sp.]|nr:hypothetical protein [Ferruginibacter sp.]